MKTSMTPIRRRLLLSACAIALAAPAGYAAAEGWNFFGGETAKGSGNVTTQTRAVPHFTGVTLGVPGSMELRMGNTEGISIETDDNLQSLIETVVEDGTLRIRPTKKNLNLRTHHLKIVVNARDIERLTTAGSGAIYADPLRAPRLELTISGSGEINVKSIDSDSAAVKVSGSGDMKVSGGIARNLSVSISGSGDVDMGKVKSGVASVKIAGSGNAVVWAQEILNVSVAGSGDVNYYGDPRVSTSIAGSGAARRLGPAPR